jgi:hypothetical protein
MRTNGKLIPPRSTSEWQAADSRHYLHPFTDFKQLAAQGARIITQMAPRLRLSHRPQTLDVPRRRRSRHRYRVAHRLYPRAACSSSETRDSTTLRVAVDANLRQDIDTLRDELHKSDARLWHEVTQASLSKKTWMFLLTAAVLGVMAHGFKWL